MGVRGWLGSLLIAFSFFPVTGRSATAAPGSLTFPAYKVQVSAPESPVFVLNKHLSLTVTLEPQAATAPAVSGFSFDARMPQHKHGMVTKAKITRLSELKYQVDGVRLHMPGEWVLDFVVSHPAGETRISVPLSLAPM